MTDALEAVYAERFEVERFLGAGLFGRVFLVRDRLSGERVALKVPQQRLPLKLARLVFLEEIDNLVMAREKPGLLQLRAFSADDPVFVATQFLRGGNVADFVKSDAEPASMQSALRAALQLFIATLELKCANRFHLDMHLGNIMFERPIAEGAELRLVDLQRCYPVCGFGAYYNFPLPSVRVSRRHPLRGVWYGLDERSVHMTACQLIVALSCKLLPPHRREMALAHHAKRANYAPRARISRALPDRLARYAIERSFPEGVPFAMSLGERAAEIITAAGGCEPDIRASLEALTLRERAFDATEDPPHALATLTEAVTAIQSRATFSTPIVVPFDVAGARTLHRALYANEARRGLWLACLARRTRAGADAALLFDLLRGLFTQQNLTNKRRILAAVLHDWKRTEAAWIYIPETAMSYKVAPAPTPNEDLPTIAASMAELLTRCAGLYGHVVICVEDAAVLSVNDRQLLDEIGRLVQGVPMQIVVGDSAYGRLATP